MDSTNTKEEESHMNLWCYTHLDQLDAFLQSSVELKWDHSWEMLHLLFGNFVVWVGGEAWIVHMLYLCRGESEAMLMQNYTQNITGYWNHER